MKTHQPQLPAAEIEAMYAIAVREHGPQGRSSRMLKQALDRELQGVGGAVVPGERVPSPRDARRNHPR